MLNMKKKLL